MSARKTTITVASAAAIAMALPAIKKSEGYWPTVKTDRIGTGHPATGGYGETEGVKLGETHDEKYWSDRLQQRVTNEYDVKIGACIHVWVPDSVRAASDSAAYNAGPAAFCRSPMVAKMNAGDFRGACEAFRGWYIRASGRVVQGLINRRNDERRLCLSGVNQKPPADAPPPPVVRAHNDFCSGSGQGADCPRRAAPASEPVIAAAPVAKPAPHRAFRKPAPAKSLWCLFFKCGGKS